MKCTRVLPRVTSGAFKYNLANSRARTRALPFGTTSATTTPFVRRLRLERLWIEQERLRSSRSSAITPRGKDSVARRNPRGEVGHILKGRAICRHNYTGKERVV